MIVQTVTDWELFIVDDCSTDDTADVLQPYLEKCPQYSLQQTGTHDGSAVSGTEALRQSTGKYVALLDNNDLWLPEKQIAYMKESGVVFSALPAGIWMRRRNSWKQFGFRPGR